MSVYGKLEPVPQPYKKWLIRLWLVTIVPPITFGIWILCVWDDAKRLVKESKQTFVEEWRASA